MTNNNSFILLTCSMTELYYQLINKPLTTSPQSTGIYFTLNVFD